MTEAAAPSGADGHDRIAPARPRVWVVDTTRPWFDGLADSGLASDEERARAVAITHSASARKLLARRSALRVLLARYLSCGPEAVRVVTAPGGKPVLIPGEPYDRSIAFSAGHSGDLYCVALGESASIGLDVEQLRAVPRARAIATRWFGEDEAATLDGVPDHGVETEFMRLWTGKEALAKRHGAGLRLMRGDDGELDVQAELSKGRLFPFAPREGYVAAIASTDIVDGIDVIEAGEDLWTI
jgi:4'-phosphopantetheinyl transferase